MDGEAKTAPTFAPLPIQKLSRFSRRRQLQRHFAPQVSASALVKRAAYGDSWGTWKKKLMQTKKIKNEAAGTDSSLKQALGKAEGGRQNKEKHCEFVSHCANRKLPTEAVLNHLRAQLPKQYELVEVVGKWIWLDVSPASQPGLAKVLWRLGFHWNSRRGVWQHPCGKFDPLGSHPTDPRTKYRCYFPADTLPA